MWKEHLINVSEILFEVGEGARQITFNRSYIYIYILDMTKSLWYIGSNNLNWKFIRVFS